MNSLAIRFFPPGFHSPELMPGLNQEPPCALNAEAPSIPVFPIVAERPFDFLDRCTCISRLARLVVSIAMTPPADDAAEEETYPNE